MPNNSSRAKVLKECPIFVYNSLHHPCKRRIEDGKLGCPECEDIFTWWEKRLTASLNPWPPR